MASASGGGSAAYDVRTPVFPSDRTPISSPMVRAYKSIEISSPRIQPATGAQIMPVIGPVSSDVLGASALQKSKLCNFTTPESIKNCLEAFCHDAKALEAFYKETLEKVQTQTPPQQPRTKADFTGASIAESNIPAIGLPPAVLMRGGHGSGSSGSHEANTGISESLREQSPGPRIISQSFRFGGFQGPVRRGSWHPSDVYAGSLGSAKERESHSGTGSGNSKDSPRSSIGEGKAQPETGAS